MSTTILIHDKEELPHQSLSTSKTSCEFSEFSEYFQKPSRINQPSYKNNLICSLIYLTFFILTIIAISYGGYYYFKPEFKTSPTLPLKSGSTTALPSFNGFDQKLNNHHYKLISDESDSSVDDSNALHYTLRARSQGHLCWSSEGSICHHGSGIEGKKRKLTHKSSTKKVPKIHESSGPFGYKLEISDVDGNVEIGK